MQHDRKCYESHPIEIAAPRGNQGLVFQAAAPKRRRPTLENGPEVVTPAAWGQRS